MTKCVEHKGKRYTSGYGCVYVDGKEQLAHRVAWERIRGAIPKDLCVCHKCDNPACVNIDHLWLGTRGDNNRDCRSKKRDKNQHKYPLFRDTTKTQKILNKTKSDKELAAEFNVSVGTIAKYRWRLKNEVR